MSTGIRRQATRRMVSCSNGSSCAAAAAVVCNAMTFSRFLRNWFSAGNVMRRLDDSSNRLPSRARGLHDDGRRERIATGETAMADGSIDTRTAHISAEEALALHASGRPGKLETRISKPITTARDLSLAYSPGVAEPCLHIQRDPALAYDYTAKGNMVAVVSNGTAVLGLGNLGAVAAKPVMEGKIALFKRFTDIDGIDLEIDSEDVDDVVNAVRFLAGFGGINLEDIKAPECFVIEQRLRELMDVPVFHDDQHGTAIVAAAGLINACHLTGRDLRDTKLVVNGAGAAG